VPSIQVPVGERPRERFRALGEHAMSDGELVALVLGRGVRGIDALETARRLLVRCGSLRRLAALSVPEIVESQGIGEVGALRLRAAFALGRRCAARVVEPGVRFRASRDLFDYYHPRLRDRKREEFIAVLLDGKHRFLREERVSLGCLDASIVHPREVFRPAVRESAGAMILVHNHPSGDPTPSREDLEVTERLVKAGELLGIDVLDHLVIAETGYSSLIRPRDGARA